MCFILIYSDFIASLISKSQVHFILYNTFKITAVDHSAVNYIFFLVCKIQLLQKAAKIIKLDSGEKMFLPKIKD